jgi:hypothetical protein
MRINANQTDIKINNMEVEDVKEFTYLVLSVQQGAQRKTSRQRKGSTSFCHVKTSVQKQGTEN